MELTDIKNEVANLSLSDENRAVVDALIAEAESAGALSDEQRTKIAATLTLDAEQKEATAGALENIASTLAD